MKLSTKELELLAAVPETGSAFLPATDPVSILPPDFVQEPYRHD